MHFGPFGYRHTNVDDMTTPDELCAAFTARGYRIASREWVEHIMLPSRRLLLPLCRAFACAAVKPAFR